MEKALRVIIPGGPFLLWFMAGSAYAACCEMMILAERKGEFLLW